MLSRRSGFIATVMALKASERFKEQLYQVPSPQSVSIVDGDLNPVLQSPSPPLYPLQCHAPKNIPAQNKYIAILFVALIP